MARKSTPPNLDLIPNTVGDFTYAGPSEIEGNSANYYFFLYKNKLNERAVLKCWFSSLCSVYAKDLLEHEIMVCKALSVDPLSDVGHGGFYVPKYIDSHVSDTTVWMLTEYIHTININTEITPFQYKEIQNFCKTLGLRSAVRKSVSQKSVAKFLVGFLLSAVYVSLRYPKSIYLVGFAFKNLFSSVVVLFNRRTYQLCHLDIKPDNILVTERGFYLIDYQFTAYTHPVFDIAFSFHRALYAMPVNKALFTTLLEIAHQLTPMEKALLVAIFSYGIFFDMAFDNETSIELAVQTLEQFHKQILTV